MTKNIYILSKEMTLRELNDFCLKYEAELSINKGIFEEVIFI